jgi:hypothetical protein
MSMQLSKKVLTIVPFLPPVVFKITGMLFAKFLTKILTNILLSRPNVTKALMPFFPIFVIR